LGRLGSNDEWWRVGRSSPGAVVLRCIRLRCGVILAVRIGPGLAVLVGWGKAVQGASQRLDLCPNVSHPSPILEGAREGGPEGVFVIMQPPDFEAARALGRKCPLSRFEGERILFQTPI
jgi:hypothetical protein